MTIANQPMIRRAFFWLLGVIAIWFSLGTIARSGPHLRNVFTFADPTGLFGTSFTALDLLANLCVLLLFVDLLRHGLGARVPLGYTFAFALKALEAFALAPCVVGRPEALCGVASVVISSATSPLIVILTAWLVGISKDAKLRRAGLLGFIVFVAAFGAAWWRIAPRRADDCAKIADLTGRGACLEKFALMDKDITVCRRIDFRATKYECVRKVAEEKRQPEVCEEIRDPAGTQVPSYELPDAETRSLCYFVLAFDLKDRSLCQKIEAEDKRQICLTRLPQARQ